MDSKCPKKKPISKRQSENMSLREEAARQIVEKYTHRLKSLVRLIINDRIRQKEGTSAVVQEVFNSFFKKSIDITDPNSFGTELLTTITRNKSKNTITRYKRIKRDYRREQKGVIVLVSSLKVGAGHGRWVNADIIGLGRSENFSEKEILDCSR